MKFLAGAFVSKETHLERSYASLITFLAGAFVFQEDLSDYDGTDELVSSAARACVLKISTNVNLLCLVIISGMKCIQS